MRKNIPCAMAFIALISSFTSEVRAESIPCAEPRLMVAPFDNRSGQQTQNYLSLALAGTLAENLETEQIFRTINGPLILTAEQARLFAGPDDLIEAGRLAKSKGAEFLVTGSFSGRPWDWNLAVEVYALDDAIPTLVGYGEAKGSQMSAFRKAGGQTVQIIGMNSILNMLTAAAEQAFDQAGLILADVTLNRLRQPPTNDAYAFQLLARSQDRHFATGRIKTDKTALEIAEYAVLVDPAYAEAQRFYAFLLAENGLPKKARIHYEQALARKPSDVRSLIALGAIEIGLNNLEEAKTHLTRATSAWPRDAAGHYWLAMAKSKLGDRDGAVAEFEKSRDADAADMDPRRELVRLYAAARRYGDAARELAVIVKNEPDDRLAAFQLAASLRAGGKLKEAAETYELIARRFADDPRPLKLRGDVLTRLGDKEAARTAYQAARTLAPTDQRLAALLGETAPTDGPPRLPAEYLVDAFGLVARVERGSFLEKEMSVNRERFGAAANDAVMELSLRGKQACVQDGSAAAAALAFASGQKYLGLGRELRQTAAILISAADRGDDAALTPDEDAESRRLIGIVADAERDLAEMRSEYRAALLPLLKLNGCPAAAEAADPETVRRRNYDRRITLPEVKPPQYAAPISPQISPDRARTVMFTIDNTAGMTDYQLVIDQRQLGPVPAGRSVNFTSSVGRHACCLLPPGRQCGDPGTVRWVFLHDGWTMVVKTAK